MPRYTIWPWAGDEDAWYQAQRLPHPVVYPSEPSFTGVLNAEGQPIYKLPDPIGFVRLK